MLSSQIDIKSPRSATSTGCLAALAEDEVRDPTAFAHMQEREKTDSAAAASAAPEKILTRARCLTDLAMDV